MVRNDALRRQLILFWIGILLGTGALALLEFLLFQRHDRLALAVTIGLALATGVLVTRHLIAKHNRPLITVQDLRAR